MKKAAAALLAGLFLAAPAFADEVEDAIDRKNKEWNVDVEELKKLSKKNKCKDVVMYREVLPFFGKETTRQASKDITIQFEKQDIAEGRAKILTSKSDCQELLGSFFVICTTDTALCYFEEPKKVADGGRKLSDEIQKKKRGKTTSSAAKAKKTVKKATKAEKK